MSKKSKRTQPKHRNSGSKRWTTEDARAELNAWRQSGLTMASYCRKQGLHVNRLYNWRKRLEDWVGDDQVGAATGRQKSLRLIEATVATQTTPSLTLRMGDGGSIEVADPERVDAGWLAQLVRGLSGLELQ